MDVFFKAVEYKQKTMHGKRRKKEWNTQSQRVDEQQQNALIHSLLSCGHGQYCSKYRSDTGGPSGRKRNADQKTSGIPCRFVFDGNPFLTQKKFEMKNAGHMDTEQHEKNATYFSDDGGILVQERANICCGGPQQDEH